MNLNNAKSLRKNMTEFELVLWRRLRDRRFCNIKFRRQVPIGKYIVDFICFDKRVIIELDGSGHCEDEQYKYDRARDEFFKSQGYRVLRFFNNELSNSMEEVLDVIYKAVQ